MVLQGLGLRFRSGRRALIDLIAGRGAGASPVEGMVSIQIDPIGVERCSPQRESVFFRQK